MAETSTIRRIILHLDDTASASRRLAFAGALAREHASELSVVYATLPGYALVPWAPEGVMPAVELLREADNERLAKASKLFTQAFPERGNFNFNPCCEFPMEPAFAQQALYSDLLVLGQHDPRDPQSGWVPPDFVSYVLSTSGKAAIVLPHSGELPARIGTVAVAWKETREAARALAASLPLLKRADRVVLLSWAEDEAWAAPGFVRARAFLRLHGIEAEDSYQGTEIPEVGELVLSRCADIGADLLVMGCYGHSRAREWVMGGATRTLLRSMTLPVLMAH